MTRNYILSFLLSLLPAVLIVYFFKPTYEEAINNRLRKSRELVISGELDSAKWEIWDVRNYEFHFLAAIKLIDSIDVLIDKREIAKLRVEIKEGIEELENGITVNWNEYPLGGFYISIINTAKYGNILGCVIEDYKVDTMNYDIQTFKNLVINFQKKEFPLMRKFYSIKVDSLLSNENIRVETNGNLNKTLVFYSDKFTKTENWEYVDCSRLEFERLRFDSLIFRKLNSDSIVRKHKLESKTDSEFGVRLPCGMEFGFLTNNRRTKK